MQRLIRFQMGTTTSPRRYFTTTKLCVGIGCGFSYILYRQGKERYRQMHFASMYESAPNTEALTQEYFGEKKSLQLNIFQRILMFLRRQIRMLHLFIKFAPLALTLPFAMLFKRALFDHWLAYMLYTLHSAGPLWIKLGQWASHRGDIFGEQITRALEQLRDSAPPHSARDTHEQFRLAFNKPLEEVFEWFDDKPVASGSIAQVHRARLNGQDVAVKVRHPNIISNLEMDIKILFKLASFFSGTLGIKSLGMPVTFDEFRKALVYQTDLRFEGQNLKVFCEKFEKNPYVVFPRPIEPYIASNVLTETFEEGIALTTFLHRERTQEHYTLANLGLKAFYKMLIYDNFIHADCHAGNILVRIREPVSSHKNWYEEWQHKLWNLQDRVFERVEHLIEQGLQKLAEWQSEDNLSKLKQENKQDQALYTTFIQSYGTQKKDIQIIFLDPGMVTILNKSDRAAFIKLVMFVTLRRPYECGQLMLQLAQYNAMSIDEQVKQKFMGEMQELFTRVCKVPLAKMNIGLVLRSMLEILRDNGMHIEGHFAALLTNMIVLEGLAKELDPDLNIVAKAASFLLHIRTIDKTIDEIIQQAL